MKPKERAKELRDKHLYCYLNPAYPLHDRFDVMQASEQALITVNEMIELVKTMDYTHGIMNYLLDVRCELNTMAIGKSE